MDDVLRSLILSPVLMSGFSFCMEYVIGAQAQTTQAVPALGEAYERMGTFRKIFFPKVPEACIAFFLGIIISMKNKIHINIGRRQQ